MGRKYRRLLEEEDVQQRHLRIAEREESSDSTSHEAAESPSHGLLNLQRSIGNQAVQRLIQRTPKAKEDHSSEEEPSVVATITGADRGKFKGTSRVVGHEGKIEFMSIQFEPKDSKMIVHLTRRVDDTSQAFMSAFINGERLTTAQFILIRRGDDGNVETLMTYDFSDGYVTGVHITSSQGIPYEGITLEFDLRKEKERE